MHKEYPINPVHRNRTFKRIGRRIESDRQLESLPPRPFFTSSVKEEPKTPIQALPSRPSLPPVTGTTLGDEAPVLQKLREELEKNSSPSRIFK